MVRLQFKFKAVASEKDSKSTVLAVITITTENKEIYEIPNEWIYMDYHTGLKSTEAYKKVINTITRRHEEIDVWIKMTEDLKKFYIDEDNNMQLNGKYLKKIVQKEEEKFGNLEKIFEKLAEKSEKKEEDINLKHVMEKFILEKFNNKRTNAKQWVENFEKECDRFSIKKDKTKIELLRLFLDGACQDWYISIILKEEQNTWSDWKEILLESFQNRGWTNRIYAHNYRYKDGSIIDYAIRKERLLLEVNKNIDQDTMIDLIALGLPENIREKINRDELENTKDLIKELKNHEGKIEKKKNYKTKEFKLQNKTNNEEKKPCTLCEKMGKNDRYHPEDKCWFKTKFNGTKEQQRVIHNNSVIEVDLQNESKNE